MSESNEQICGKCGYWRDIDPFTEKRHGVCIAPSVQDASYGIMEDGICGVQIGPFPMIVCGPKFGCIHWKAINGDA